MKRFNIIVSSLIFTLSSWSAIAIEYPIGQPHHRYGMEIAAVYLQPIMMEPEDIMGDVQKTDIHLEMDISATDGNGNGFEAGSWIPYLMVSFKLTKAKSEWHAEGNLMPMVANDGPHYGDNVKLAGPGRYYLTFKVSPPSANKHNHFGRHTDRLTGVRPWFKPFEAKYEFVYTGITKKGGY